MSIYFAGKKKNSNLQLVKIEQQDIPDVFFALEFLVFFE